MFHKVLSLSKLFCGIPWIPWDSGMFFNLPYTPITFHRVPSLFLWLWSFTILSYLILSHFSNLPLSARFWWLDIIVICTNIWEVILVCDTGTIELFLYHDSHNPLCLPTYVLYLALFCHNHILSHLYFAIMMILLTVSPTLIPRLTHSLLIFIFS